MNKKLESILLEAGNLALNSQDSLVINKKPDDSIVSNGDLNVSNFLEKSLKKTYKGYSIFSEENPIPPSRENVIIIDPIDGTESYVRKESTWCILIGFVKNGIPVEGVIYQPSKNTFYYAKKGFGAYKSQNNLITKMEVKKVGEITGTCSFSDYGETDFFNKKNISTIEKSYSASLKIMSIADGIHDLYPNFRKKCSLWDLVAPELILNESGGFIQYDRPLTYDYTNTHINQNFIASSKRIII